MSKAVYITTTESNTGKSIISIGLMHLLLGKAAKVGYFKPIIEDDIQGQPDSHIETITNYFNLNIDFEDLYAYKRAEVIDKLNEGKEDEIINHIINKYKAIEKNFDIVLVEGSGYTGEGTIIEFDFNVLIAKNLGIPAIFIASGADKKTKTLTSEIQIAYDTFADKGVEVLAVIANKVRIAKHQKIIDRLRAQLPEKVLVGAIPLNPALSNPSLREIVKALDAKILFGQQYLNNLAGSFNVGAMQLRNYITHLQENGLVITPGDRADIILGALQAHQSSNYPAVAGIVLTGGLIPEKSIVQLIEGLSDVVPIISVEGGTFAIANKIGAIQSKIHAANTPKIKMAINDFKKHLDTEALAERLVTFESEGITPRMFQYNLLRRAKTKPQHIVLPEGEDERVLKATAQLVEVGAVKVTLLGDTDKILQNIDRLDLNLDTNKIAIINPTTSDYFETYAQTLYDLRKHKNVNLAMAKDLMADVSYFGSMMVYMGDADGMVSGAVNTTQHTIRPALQFIKTRPDVSIVSSVFFMCLEDRVSVYGDCAINPNPTAAQLAEIAISSAITSQAFGIDPKIAMLSYSSGASGKGEDVERVREATTIVKERRPDLKIEGPIQYDAAVDSKVGKTKMPDSEVAGQANVFIFPDLNTGNNTYKAVQRETKALAIGPVIQGLNKPVNDLSRGCTTEDIYNTVIITAIQAQGM